MEFYRGDLREEISQGDIFPDVPVLYAKAHTFDGESPAIHPDIRHVNGILLTHDCEYEKKSSIYIYVAEIVSLKSAESGQAKYIRDGRVISAFYLPRLALNQQELGECYADLRRISRVDKRLLDLRKNLRIASLGGDARLALQRSIGVFFGIGRATEP